MPLLKLTLKYAVHVNDVPEINHDEEKMKLMLHIKMHISFYKSQR